MFTKNDTPQLDDAINNLHEQLTTFNAETPEYANLMNHLETLYKIKNETRSDRVKPDTMALIAGNLAGIMLIVGHERAHVVTSKALGFVSKLK